MSGDWLAARVIGHRGAAAHAPENTIAGLARAAALGVAMVEVDAKLSRDGIPVLFHDDRLDRTTNGKGPVAQADHETLSRLDAGSWFGPAFAGEPIPTLAAAIAEMTRLKLALNLEIKPCPGRERETAEIALAVAQAHWPADRPPPLVSSFAVECLEVAQVAAPDWPRGLLLERATPGWDRLAQRLDAASVNIAAGMASAVAIAGYRRGGRRCLAYTVNDAMEAESLLAMGMDAVISDCPDLILARLAGRRPA
ncbi:MAG: glycerophosphodiester phosphodiesterase [Rhodospirillaceae bacterium]|nr:glycerophosphodiester phosphodiesterase [Rhodospirillaceae bacterium]